MVAASNSMDVPDTQTQTMLAWRKSYKSKQPFRLEVPVPSAPDDGMLVKVYAAGVCHSDVAILGLSKPVEGYRYAESFTMGHEGCGKVVSVGPRVVDFAPGDLVSIVAVPGCNEPTCAECSRGMPQVCVTGPHYGIEGDGSFAPYVAIKASAAVKLPAGVGFAAGAVATDAIASAYHAVVGRAQVQAGETVLLYGLGGLGFNALQILLSLGARVVVVDKRQAVLDEAVRFGVRSEDVVPAGTKRVAKWIAERKLVIDKAVDFVGVPESFDAAVQSVRIGGTIVLVGILAYSLELRSVTATFKQLNILASYGGTREDLQVCLDLIAKGVINPQVETDSMADFPQVLERLHEGKIKSRVALIPEGLEDEVEARDSRDAVKVTRRRAHKM